MGGVWRHIEKSNQYQFKAATGENMNWWPRTGGEFGCETFAAASPLPIPKGRGFVRNHFQDFGRS
jgi:hypothetical protein